MRCILHIGTEKTGTTTFQRHFAVNRAKLAEQGVLYPISLGLETHRRLCIVALSMKNADDAFRGFSIENQQHLDQFKASVAKDFADEIAANTDKRVCIISSEHLHSRLKTRAQVERVYAFLRTHFDDIKVVVHLRPQVEVLVSLASTQIRVGGAVRRGFFEKAKPDNLYFNYNRIIHIWSDVFGEDSVVCVPFKRSPDFTSFITQQIGINRETLSPLERINEALDIKVMALANTLADSGTAQSKIHHKVLDQLPVREKLKLGRGFAQEIQNRFSAVNQTLVQRRSDLKPGDLLPQWSTYSETGNLDQLEERCFFSEAISDLITYYNGQIQAKNS